MQIGVIGCGNMGGGMVSCLVQSGQAVGCFDPDQQIREQMSSVGATVLPSASAVAEQSRCIILSLPTSSVVETVMADIETSIHAGAIVLDTSTSVPETSQAQARRAKELGFDFVDGPVSGGPIAANAGSMTMLLGGSAEAIENLQPVLDILTAKTVIVGASGAGHAAKIANNMLCAANLVLVAEAIRVGKASGVAAEDLLEGINAGSGRSAVSELNFPKWVLNGAFDSGFTMGLMRKDVKLALDLAAATGVSLSGFSGVADIWLNQSQQVDDSADFNQITTL